MYRALLRFLTQPMGKPAIPQATSAISIIQLSFHPYGIAQQPPIPINSSPSAQTGSDTGVLEDANTTLHKGPWLLSVTAPPPALGMALQFANWLC